MNIKWRRKAETRLDRASVYCARMFGQRVAYKFLDSIAHQALLLTGNPYIGSLEPLLAARPTSYRSLVVHEHYKLIYWVDEKKGTLYISDLWDTPREPQSLVEGTPNK